MQPIRLALFFMKEEAEEGKGWRKPTPKLWRLAVPFHNNNKFLFLSLKKAAKPPHCAVVRVTGLSDAAIHSRFWVARKYAGRRRSWSKRHQTMADTYPESALKCRHISARAFCRLQVTQKSRVAFFLIFWLAACISSRSGHLARRASPRIREKSSYALVETLRMKELNQPASILVGNRWNYVSSPPLVLGLWPDRIQPRVKAALPTKLF
jgi:hypothetical protein